MALFSLILPGSGQFVLGDRQRGLTFFLGILGLAGIILVQDIPVLLAFVLGIWLWNVYDALSLARGHRLRLGIPTALGAVALFTLAVFATEIQPRRLITGWPAMQPYLRALVRPELLEYPTEDLRGQAPIQVPCIDPLPPPSKPASEQPRVTIDSACASVGETIDVSGEGFFPNFEAEIWWVNPIGDVQRILRDRQPLSVQTNDQGRFQVRIEVPLAVPVLSQPGPGETQTHVLRVEQHRPYGTLQPTETLALVLEKIGETIALAFMATVLGMVFAVPVSFLAARNLMGGSPIGLGIYYVVRTLLNIIRSIETLIWAIVFAVWVGLGPFGGMLALMFHTIAALGKLYSEAIESIDPGPIEAIRATGARGPQVVVYAVLPQILPTFSSFTLFRWDINVRMSTVIGLISDAGLGFLVIQWIRLNRFSSMATAIIAIVLVVAVLDYVSAWLRQRILEGTPARQQTSAWRRYALTSLSIVVVVVGFVFSWQVAEIDLIALIEGAPAGLRLARAFFVPELFTRPTEQREVSATLPVPCSSGESSRPEESGPRVNLSPSCGSVGDPLVIQAHELPSNTEVSVRWTLSDGAYLRVDRNCCTTDNQGNLQWHTTIHPLMQVDPKEGQTEPGQVVVTWKEVVGGPQLSDAFHTVVDLSVVTLLMALVSTVIGTIFAIPLSFLAARNIVGEKPIGQGVYYTFRTVFNLWRSIEPMILALICSAWVGVGPFAGVLALAINNIPNLGKLFSETIEQIDTGPVEAITATGANRPQVLVYGIIPQLVPKFLAFILYQWDINIRMSTVIGFVGGGGIGQQFRVWVGLNQYGAAGMATWAIVAMVWSMDYLSARARERLV